MPFGFGGLPLFATSSGSQDVPLPIITNNTLWLRADKGITLNGADVSAWDDQSGNGRHFTQGTATAQPFYNSTAFNGKPGIQFDGVDELLTSTATVDNIMNNNAYTLFAVFSMTSVDTDNGNSWLNDGIISDSASFVGMHLAFGGPRFISYQWDGSDDSNQIGIQSNHTYAIMQRYNGTLMRTYIALLDMTFDRTSGSISTTTGTMRLGCNSSSSYFNGYIHEIICYDDAKSDGDVTTIMDYLTSFWGLTLPAEAAIPDSANLLYHVRADRGLNVLDNAIALVKDLQGDVNGNLEQATSANRPAYGISDVTGSGRGLMIFDGTNDVLTSVGAWTTAQPLTMYIVARQPTPADAQTMFDGGSEDFVISLRDNSGSGGPLGSLNIYAGGTPAPTFPGGIDWSNITIAAITFNGSGGSGGWVNNSLIGFTGGGSVGSEGILGISLGASDGPSEYFNGSILALMIYDGDHNTGIFMNEIMDWLAARYNAFGAVYYDLPTCLPWNGWWRGSFFGSPWSGEVVPSPGQAAGVGGVLSEGTNPPSIGFGAGIFTSADFDGVDDRLISGSNLGGYVAANNGYVVVLFYARTAVSGASVGSGYEDPALFGGSGGGTTFGVHFSDVGVRCVLHDGVWQDLILPCNTGQWNLAQFKWDGFTLYGKLNSDSWTSISAGSISDLSFQMVVGENYVGTQFFDGEVLEIMALPAYVQDDLGDVLVNYIADRYGIFV